MQVSGPVEPLALPSANRLATPERRAASGGGASGERPGDGAGEHSGIPFGDYAKRLGGEPASDPTRRAPGVELSAGAEGRLGGGMGGETGAAGPGSAEALAAGTATLAPAAASNPAGGPRTGDGKGWGHVGSGGARATTSRVAMDGAAAASPRGRGEPGGTGRESEPDGLVTRAAPAIREPGPRGATPFGAQTAGVAFDRPEGPSPAGGASPIVGETREWMTDGPARGGPATEAQARSGKPRPAGALGVAVSDEGPRSAGGLTAGEKVPEAGPGRMTMLEAALQGRADPGGRAQEAQRPGHAHPGAADETVPDAPASATKAKEGSALPGAAELAAGGPGRRAGDGLRPAGASWSAAGSTAPAEISGGSGLAPAAPVSPPPAQNAIAAASPGGTDFARAVTSQIAGAIVGEAGTARIELRLDPPELGRLEISLEIVDQSLRATVAADRAGTHDLLRRHADLLLAQLQQAGFSGVDLRFAGEQHRAPGGSRAGEGAPGEADRPDDAPPSGPGHASLAQGTQGLDLRF